MNTFSYCSDFYLNPTTWRLAAINMAIRGIDFNFGKEPVNSFTNDQHPDLRAYFVVANLPFKNLDTKRGFSARRKQTLLIHARELGSLIGRIQREQPLNPIFI